MENDLVVTVKCLKNEFFSVVQLVYVVIYGPVNTFF